MKIITNSDVEIIIEFESTVEKQIYISKLPKYVVSQSHTFGLISNKLIMNNYGRTRIEIKAFDKMKEILKGASPKGRVHAQCHGDDGKYSRYERCAECRTRIPDEEICFDDENYFKHGSGSIICIDCSSKAYENRE